MNRRKPGDKKRQTSGPASRRPANRPAPSRTPPSSRSRSSQPGKDRFDIVERNMPPDAAPDSEVPAVALPGPFRVLIAIHRPRYRGRAQRAADLAGWSVTVLLNKQDPVGLVARPPRPPDLLLLSGDFGRQRDYAIFRAVQMWRKQGMRLIGLVDDCTTAPEAHPDSAPERLCDICLVPPYKMADIRAVLARLYEEMRGEPAPPPRTGAEEAEEQDE